LQATRHLSNLLVVLQSGKYNHTMQNMRMTKIYSIPHYTERTDSKITRKSQFHESLPKIDVNKGPITLTFGRGNKSDNVTLIDVHVIGGAQF